MEKENLEKRLLALEQQLKTKANDSTRPKKWKLKTIAPMGFVIIIAIALSSIVWLDDNRDPVPNAIQKAVVFPVYYPSPIPKGYNYKAGSWKIEDGMVFYELQNGNRSITFGEQSTPSNLPKLTDIPSFNNLDTSIGKAAIGANGTQPAAVIATKSTLIAINSDSTDIASSTISGIAQSMRP